MTELIAPQIIPVDDLLVNEGQIPGVPANPRFIKDHRYNSLKNSIRKHPDFIFLRELIVYQFDGKYIILAGNMRFRAMIELSYPSCPCKVVPQDTPVEKIRKIILIDNSDFGQHDWNMLVSDWEEIEIMDVGFILPGEWAEEEEKEESEGRSSDNVIKLQYTEDEYAKVIDGLQRIDQSPEQAVWKLLGLPS